MDPESDNAASWLNIVLATLFTIYYVIKLLIIYAAIFSLYVIQLALKPLSLLLNIVLFACSPLIYLGHLALAPFVYFADILPRLQPLYIYFGTAACAGIFAGLLLQFSSSTIVSILGLDVESHQSEEDSTFKLKLEQGERDSRPGTADSFTGLPDIGSSAESDWRQWPNSHTKRKRKSPGLLSHETILEEDDDSI